MFGKAAIELQAAFVGLLEAFGRQAEKNLQHLRLQSGRSVRESGVRPFAVGDFAAGIDAGNARRRGGFGKGEFAEQRAWLKEGDQLALLQDARFPDEQQITSNVRATIAH